MYVAIIFENKINVEFFSIVPEISFDDDTGSAGHKEI